MLARLSAGRVQLRKYGKTDCGTHHCAPRLEDGTSRSNRGVGWCSGQPVPCGGIHSRESVGSDPVLAPALEFCVWRSRFALPDYITARNQGDRGLPEPSKARASSPAGFRKAIPGFGPATADASRDHVTTTGVARPTYPLRRGKPRRCLARAQPDQGAGVTDGSGLGLWVAQGG